MCLLTVFILMRTRNDLVPNRNSFTVAQIVLSDKARELLEYHNALIFYKLEGLEVF